MSEVTQRSHEWRKMRLGYVTASRFKDVLRQPTTKRDREAGELSQSAQTYLTEKIAEMLTGTPLDRWTNQAVQWGQEWEEEAFQRAIPVIAKRFERPLDLPVGDKAFIVHPNEANIGCSPDGFIGQDMLCEIKCPANPVNHLRTHITGDMPSEHAPQVQGSLWITGRERYAFISYDPRVEKSGLDPLVVIQVDRDSEYIETLAERVIDFRDRLLAKHEELMREVNPF